MSLLTIPTKLQGRELEGDQSQVVQATRQPLSHLWGGTNKNLETHILIRWNDLYHHPFGRMWGMRHKKHIWGTAQTLVIYCHVFLVAISWIRLKLRCSPNRNFSNSVTRCTNENLTWNLKIHPLAKGKSYSKPPFLCVPCWFYRVYPPKFNC